MHLVLATSGHSKHTEKCPYFDAVEDCWPFSNVWRFRSTTTHKKGERFRGKCLSAKEVEIDGLLFWETANTVWVITLDRADNLQKIADKAKCPLIFYPAELHRFPCEILLTHKLNLPTLMFYDGWIE